MCLCKAVSGVAWSAVWAEALPFGFRRVRVVRLQLEISTYTITHEKRGAKRQW